MKSLLKPTVLASAATLALLAAALLSHSPAQAQQNAPAALKPPAPAAAEWTEVFSKGAASMAVSPDGGLLVAGVMRKGFYGSTDDGQTWNKLGAEDKEQIISLCTDILFDPKDSKTFWVSGAYEPSLFKSADAGKTFQRISPLWHMDNIAVDFSDPQRQTMLAGMHETSRRFYRTTDGGKSWWNIAKPRPDYAGFPEKLGIASPAILDSKTYLIGCNPSWLARDGIKNGIVLTEDAGATWTKVSDLGPTGHPLVAASGSIFWHTDKALIKSADGGKTWQDVPTVTVTPIEIPTGIGASPGTGINILLSAKGKQLYTSTDDGATWKTYLDPAPTGISELGYSIKTKSIFMKGGPKIYRLNTNG